MNNLDDLIPRKEDCISCVKAGSTINFKECTYHYPYKDKIEFYKDGGWGIASNDGFVILSNNIVSRPSDTHPHFGNDSTLAIIQNRETKKYGVLSFKSFKEVIHCQYDKIEIADYYNNDDLDGIKTRYLKALKNGKWGCFDENCKLLLNCLYQDIRYINGYFEGVRDGYYICNDKIPTGFDEKNYDSIYVGKKDLYDSNGVLQIGGYDELEFCKGFLLFYWGTSYKIYEEIETGMYGEIIRLSKYKLSYENSNCLIVDHNFVSINKYQGNFVKVQKGNVYGNIDSLKKNIPRQILLPFRVELYDFDNGFIYLYNENGGSFVCPLFCNLGVKEELIEDDTVIIIHYTKEMDEDFKTSVNEIRITENFQKYYRIGTKYGFYSSKGIERNLFDAIIENWYGDLFVAKIEDDTSILESGAKENHKIDYFHKINNNHFILLDSIRDVYKFGKIELTIPLSFPYTDVFKGYDKHIVQLLPFNILEILGLK